MCASPCDVCAVLLAGKKALSFASGSRRERTSPPRGGSVQNVGIKRRVAVVSYGVPARQFGLAASADRLKAAPDQRGNLRIGLRYRGENLPTTGRCLDITNVHPQMSLVVRRARICFASGNVNPSLAMSPRSPNGPISTT